MKVLVTSIRMIKKVTLTLHGTANVIRRKIGLFSLAEELDHVYRPRVRRVRGRDELRLDESPLFYHHLLAARYYIVPFLDVSLGLD